jgi:uncharacterized protein (TIGR00266 family)
MRSEVLYRPAFAVARVTLGDGETVRAEAGAMVSMSANVGIETSATGGFMKSLKRSVLGGESFFLNTFRASGGEGEVLFAPPLAGDIVMLDIPTQGLMVQSGSFLVGDMGIDVDTKWGGAKSFFASEGLILLRLSGQGQALVSSYGAIHEMTLAAGERYTVDTGHLVAFDQTMQFNVRRVGGLKSTLFSGEGLVVDIQGPGKLLMQTRSPGDLLAWIIPQIPRDHDNN